MTLVQINLLDGMDYSKLKENELTRILGVSVHQWHMARNQVIQSFNGSIGELTEKYQAGLATKQKYRMSTKDKLGKSWEKKRLEKQQRISKIVPEDTFLSDQSIAPVIMQPTKATRFRPNKVDPVARLSAQNAVFAVKSGAKPVNRLVDKG